MAKDEKNVDSTLIRRKIDARTSSSKEDVASEKDKVPIEKDEEVSTQRKTQYVFIPFQT